MEVLERLNSVATKVTWVVLAIGLVNHFVFEFMPRLWESRLLTVLWILVVLTIFGQVAAWLGRRFARARTTAAKE